MDKLITVLTFNYPQEAAVIKARLESEDIPGFLADELTVQVYNFYSNAIGGVKLHVRESDLSKAVQILKEGGYLTEEDLATPRHSVSVNRVIIISIAALLLIALAVLYSLRKQSY